MRVRGREVVNCPHCGAENPSSGSRCGSCSKGLVVYIGPAQNLPRRFGLGSLMVLVATVAVGLGALRGAPVLGVLILALVPPAVVRSMAVVAQRAADGRPMSLDEKVAVFVGSIGVIVAVVVASLIACAVVCMPAGSMAASAGGGWMPVALALGAAAGVLAGWWTLRKLWPYKG